MGNNAAGVGKQLFEKIAIGMPSLSEHAEAVAHRHNLCPDDQLEELLDHLFGLSCRDQEEDAFDPERMTERRREGHALAKSMRKEARVMLQSLDRLLRYYRAFEETVRSSPALLETIFDVDTGGPENLCLPAELAILQTLFVSEIDAVAREFAEADPDLALESGFDPAAACPPVFWDAVDDRLQAVVNLPVKPRLPGGRVPNAVVRSALFACRSYWKGLGHSWTMSSLKLQEVRHDNEVHTLQGKCERFVADALTVTGIRFNLPELHSSWEHIDSEARRSR